MTLSTNAQCQKKRLLDYLKQHNRITTLEARTELDVMHPAARIQELKEDGNPIVTYKRVVDTGLGRHIVAEYVFFQVLFILVAY